MNWTRNLIVRVEGSHLFEAAMRWEGHKPFEKRQAFSGARSFESGGNDGAVVLHGHPFDLQGADFILDEHEFLITAVVPGKVSGHSPVVQGFCRLEQIKVGVVLPWLG